MGRELKSNHMVDTWNCGLNSDFLILKPMIFQWNRRFSLEYKAILCANGPLECKAFGSFCRGVRDLDKNDAICLGQVTTLLFCVMFICV